ncbi:hypothetical protein C8R45DRAFT_1211381 [Mycena sanguinolenta]|nr:hypothetical protein C8R45DRAFT_1211381 [Mycena sanguinolenta]
MPNHPTTTQKQPFQDITDRFISPRPKRKPGGTLGEKLRLRAAAEKVFPSSLPPSSPPLYQSSSSQWMTDREVAHGTHEDAAEPFGHEDFGSMLPSDEEGDPDAENRAPANLSDPFGFFAVERKLKAQRETQPAVTVTALRASRPTDDKERDDGLIMPSTPHKPAIGKRALSDVVSPANTSLSASPSPVKAVRDRDSVMNTSQEFFAAQADDDDAPRKSKKPRKSSEEPLPLRRSTRGQTKVLVEKGIPKLKQRARKAPAKAKGKTKGKGKKAVEDDDPDDLQEKFEAERLARLEYFRKLDDYSFEKENVYVV